MRGVLVAVLAFLFAVAAVSAPAKASSEQPIAFTKNMGQWPDSILFRASAKGEVMWFTKDGVYHQFFRRVPRPDSGNQIDRFGRSRPFNPTDRFERDSIETTMIKAEFVGSNPDVEVVGLEELDYKCNYFLGNDPAKWRTDVPNYSSVTFKGLYPGVDVLIGEHDGRLKCRLTAASSADFEQVRTAYLCNGAVTKETENRVSIQTPFGKKRFAGILPVDETEPAGAAITSSQSPNSGISLVYSTYLGGNSGDRAEAIAVNRLGNSLIVGYTVSTNFPTELAYQSVVRGTDVFATKLSATGNSLIYSTYLGGGGDDRGYDIAVDTLNNAYLTGITSSTDYPTQSAYQTNQPAEDAFVTKLAPTGNSLVYSTYLGGFNRDEGTSIAVDRLGSAYVTGITSSTLFPTQTPFQTEPGDGENDVFLTKFAPAGSSLLYSTYLGGTSADGGYGIAVDGSGCAYVTGYTLSTDYPTSSPYQLDQPGFDAFITKVATAGNSLVYSTYLGGESSEYGYDIAVSASGKAYVTGFTSSANFPTQLPCQTDQLGADVYISVLSASGSSLYFSTYLGGDGTDIAYGIAIDRLDNIYVTGITESSDFPVLYAFQMQPADTSQDCFVTKLSATSSSVVYSTYLGGGRYEEALGISTDASGNAYLAGYTYSIDFPTQSPYQTDPGDASVDAFVSKIQRFPLCCTPDAKLRGDFSNGGGSFPNGDGVTDGSDLQTCVDYVFFNDVSTLVECLESQDVNDDLLFDGGDLGILVDYIFFNDTSIIKRCDGSPF